MKTPRGIHGVYTPSPSVSPTLMESHRSTTCPDHESRGAPYLARFSRDVGYNCSRPECFRAQQTNKVEVRGTPHLAKYERDVGHPLIRGQDGPAGTKSAISRSNPPKSGCAFSRNL